MKSVNVSGLYSISFLLLSFTHFFSPPLCVNSVIIVTRELMAWQHEPFAPHSPQERQRSATVPFPLVRTLSIQVDTSEPLLER